MPNTVTMKGDPLTLLGEMPAVGDAAPAFELVGNDLSRKTLADFDGKVKILASVPSLDTSVCDKETRRFNEEACNLADDIVVLTVSLDLPFAAKRWCAANGIDRVITLSDYLTREFSQDYGVLVDGLMIAARAIFVVGKDNKVAYVQLVSEIADEPDYDAALAAAKAAV